MKRFDKKLKLNKKTITNLNSEDLDNSKGGSYHCNPGGGGSGGITCTGGGSYPCGASSFDSCYCRSIRICW